jgi:hypothetical protein
VGVVSVVEGGIDLALEPSDVAFDRSGQTHPISVGFEMIRSDPGAKRGESATKGGSCPIRRRFGPEQGRQVVAAGRSLDCEVGEDGDGLAGVDLEGRSGDFYFGIAQHPHL